MKIFRRQCISEHKTRSIDDKHRTLGIFDLTLLGVGAVIGTGVLVLPGVVAATMAGPGELLSYIIAGVAAFFVVLCYAEFASSIPSAGGSYTYAYVSLGEIIGYLVGTTVIVGYIVALGLVANGWASYFYEVLKSFDIVLPLSITAMPSQGGIINLPAAIIVLIMIYILSRGTKESKVFNNAIVLIKLAVIILFLIVGAFYFKSDNFTPFLPNGMSGVFSGSAVLFLAYTGFDVTASAAEETKNPQKTMPIALILAITLCIIIYCLVAIVLVGMVKYTELNQADALAYALYKVGQNFVALILSLGAILGILSIIFGIAFGCSRILATLSKDRLVPVIFEKTNSKGVPAVSLWFCGIIGAILAGFVNLNILANFTSMALLFAYLIVSLGVIVFRKTNPNFERGFKTPFVPVIPILSILCCGFLMFSLPVVTWIYFICFLILTIIFYFTYSIKNSKLSK